MKKLFLLAALAVTVMAHAQTITLGDNTTISNQVPIHTLYNYSLTEHLFLADEIEFAGNIRALRVGAVSVVKVMIDRFPRLRKILADGGYQGETLANIVKKDLGGELSVVLRPNESSKKFSVIPKRWIVERSFSWLENFRRVAIDYEFFSESSLAMLQIAFSAIMLKKLL